MTACAAAVTAPCCCSPGPAAGAAPPGGPGPPYAPDRESTPLKSPHHITSHIALFFLMIRRPPISTLFPFPTLFRSAYGRRGEQPAKKDALTRDLLEQLLQTCDDSLRGRRDRALLLFAWSSGGRRRSEVAGADMRH